MMLAAGDTLVDAKKTGAEAGKVRRKSRDLEDSLGMPRTAEPRSPPPRRPIARTSSPSWTPPWQSKLSRHRANGRASCAAAAGSRRTLATTASRRPSRRWTRTRAALFPRRSSTRWLRALQPTAARLATLHCPAPQAIRKVEAGVVGADMDSMYEFADKDGDGKISYEEFKKIMLYKQAPPKA